MVSKTYEARCWESNIERKNALKVLDMLWGEGNVEGLDILVQVLDLATTNDGEDVRSLLHHVCDSDYDRKKSKDDMQNRREQTHTRSDTLSPNFGTNLFECLRDLALIFVSLPVFTRKECARCVMSKLVACQKSASEGRI